MKKIISIVIFTTITYSLKAQTRDTTASKVFTADSIASGNTKDVFINFLQLAYNNLSGSNHEFNFTSNPYAVMLRSNPNLNRDDNYTRYRNLRRLNFSFGLKLDSNYKFNGFSSGLKYAIVDERDATTSFFVFNSFTKDSFNIQRKILKKGLDSIKNNMPTDTDEDVKKKALFGNYIDTLFGSNKFDKPFVKLDISFQATVKQIIRTRNLNHIEKLMNDSKEFSFYKVNKTIVEGLKESIKTASLWTIGISDTTYKDQFLFSNIAIVSEYSKGIGQLTKGVNVEFNAKTTLNFTKDTLQEDRNLKRLVNNTEAGLNLVWRDKDNQKSYFELKLAAAYFHNFNNLYLGEERSRFTLNGTARVRIYDDLWIPFEIKYDPSNGNVFGFLSIKSNFTGLASLLNGR